MCYLGNRRSLGTNSQQRSLRRRQGRQSGFEGPARVGGTELLREGWAHDEGKAV